MLSKRMSWHFTSIWLLLTAVALGVGCRQEPAEPGGKKATVVVSIAPQAWLIEQVAGEAVDVVTLVESGASPATYQPSDAQISRVMRAAMYVRIGVPFEQGPWFEAIRASGKLKIVDARRGIQLRTMAVHRHHEEHGHEAEHAAEHGHDHHGGQDPHIWLSPRLLKVQARTVAEALGELVPDRRADLQRNRTALEAKLDDADRAIRGRLEPLRGKAFFVFHPAWGYFADEYGLRQVAVEIEGKEPSDRELTALQQQARDSEIRVIFVQPQISGKSAAAVAQAIGGRVEQLDPLAADVLTNLLHVAEALAESWPGRGERGNRG